MADQIKLKLEVKANTMKTVLIITSLIVIGACYEWHIIHERDEQKRQIEALEFKTKEILKDVKGDISAMKRREFELELKLKLKKGQITKAKAQELFDNYMDSTVRWK